MQRDQNFRKAPEVEESSLLDALLTTAPSLLNRYQNRLIAIRDTFLLELKLNLKCGALVLFIAVVLGCVLFSAWIGLNVLVYFGLLSFDAPLWAIVLTIVGIHILALVSLYRAIRVVISEIGFNQSLDALGLSASAGDGET